ncbi:MAG TPA: ABC transporter ATP-binding protein [Chthoniobacterales bacterium]
MILLKNVSRRYRQGDNVVLALDDVSLHVPAFAFVSITGESGSGKSTLLHLLGGLDLPDDGTVTVDGLSLGQASERQLTDYRRSQLGIVFQFFNLLPTLSVLENACLPLELQGVRDARQRAKAMLELVGMAHRQNHFVHQLSGGEMQRTAIARALVHRPKVLLADEPTGNLDADNAARVLELFQRIHAERLTTLVVVTHSSEVAALTRREIQLRQGRIFRDRAVPQPGSPQAGESPVPG